MDDNNQEDYYSDSSSSHSSYTYSESGSAPSDVSDTDSAYSDESDDSSGASWGGAASAASMKQAFAEPVAPTLNNDVDMSRRHLRKQESRYSNKNTESVLPMTAHGTRSCSSEGLDDFMLIDETSGKEMVGHYVDSRGHPVAEVWESKPPPANADYKSTAPETSNLNLTRLMGYDAHKEIKKGEIKGIVNPSQRLNGDADLSRDRLAQTSEITARNVYFNKKHAQTFADYDFQRSDMYDGFNDKRTPTERVHRLEPTNRNDTGEFREPGLGHTESGKQINNVTTTRLEISKPWTRHPHKNPSGSFNIPSVTSLPILPDTHRNNASDNTPNAHNGAHASFALSPRNENEDRPEKNTHIYTHTTLPDGGNNSAPVLAQKGDNTESQRDNTAVALPGAATVVSQAIPQIVDNVASEREHQPLPKPPTGMVDVAPRAPIPQIVDSIDTDREQHMPKPKIVDSTAWAAMVKQLDTERDTEDDDAEIAVHMRSAYTNAMLNVTSGATLQAVQVANEDACPLPIIVNRTNMPVPRTQVAASATAPNRSDVTEAVLPGNNSGGGVEHRSKDPKSTSYRQADVETARTNLAVSQNVASPLSAASHTQRHGMELNIIGFGSVQGKGEVVGSHHDLLDGNRQLTSLTSLGSTEQKGRYVRESTDALDTERERKALSINHGAIETNAPRQRIHHNNVSHARQELENDDDGHRGRHLSLGASHQLLKVDRIPVVNSAIYHFELGGNSSGIGGTHRSKELSRLDTNRTHLSESDPVRAHAAFEQATHAREVAPVRALAGEKFGPDRLSTYHPIDRQKIDAGVRSALSNLPDRSTPVLRTFASTPIQHHRIEQEFFDSNGRETPNCRIGRPTKLP